MNDKKKILWISYCVPYDSVPHAGGQIHNYYLKSLMRQIYMILNYLHLQKRKT